MPWAPALRAHALAGAVGSLVLAIGALGLGWLPPLFDVGDVPVLSLLRTTVAGEAMGRAAVLIGGALVLQSWLLLGVDVLSAHRVDTPGLRRTLALWLAPTLLVPPLFSRDPYSYFVQGRLMQLGLDPYRNGAAAVPGWFQAGVDPMWAETPTPYGPLSLLLERLVVDVAGTPFWSAVGFRLLALTGIALMAVAVPRLAEQHGIDGAAALWLAVLNPLVLLHFALGGHNDAIMVGCMVVGLEQAGRRRPLAATLWLAAAVAVKPIALVVVPFAALMLQPEWRGYPRLLARYAASGAAVLLPVLLLGAGLGVGVGWVSALTTPGSVRTWLSPTTALGMVIGLVGDAAGFPQVDEPAVAVVRVLGIGLALLACALLLLRPRGRTPLRGALLAFTAIIGLGPVVQPWYLLWALPLAAASGLQRPWHLRAAVLGTAAFVIYGLAEPTATSDAHLDLVDSLGMLLAGAVVLLVLLASPRERELALGRQFGAGLVPRDAAAEQRAASRRVR